MLQRIQQLLGKKKKGENVHTIVPPPLPIHFAPNTQGLREGIYRLCQEPQYKLPSFVCLSSQTYFAVITAGDDSSLFVKLEREDRNTYYAKEKVLKLQPLSLVSPAAVAYSFLPQDNQYAPCLYYETGIEKIIWNQILSS